MASKAIGLGLSVVFGAALGFVVGSFIGIETIGLWGGAVIAFWVSYKNL